MKVYNMTSSRGNSVPNQFIIEMEKGSYFQSYNSMIAFIDLEGNITFDQDKWNYSVTTGKYRNMFTRLTTKETQKAIKDGKIKFDKL